MRQIKKKATCLMVTAAMLLTTVHAEDFASSTLATGTQRLLHDVMNYLVIICPITGALMAVYFLIRRGVADEQDGKMWTKRIFVSIGCGVGGALVSGIISMLASYY